MDYVIINLIIYLKHIPIIKINLQSKSNFIILPLYNLVKIEKMVLLFNQINNKKEFSFPY